MASVQQQEGYFRDLVERLVHQFEGRAHYDDEVAIIREAREALMKTENVSTSVGHGDGVTVGNVAEIREALQDVLFMAEKHAANSPATSAVIFDRDTGKVAREINYLQAIEKARFALGAPARNCDVYKTEKDARKAFYNCYFGPTEDEFVNAAFIDWLFTPTEGGAK